MEKASKVMYKIANVFNWILLVCGIIFLIFGILVNTGAIQATGSDPEAIAAGAVTLIVFGVWFIIDPIVMIVLTRKAEKAGASKGWDILFLVLGIIGENVFYFLGGLFGLIRVTDLLFFNGGNGWPQGCPFFLLRAGLFPIGS
jgi:uncharacterized membrane protein HdeD (DUF308 family)